MAYYSVKTKVISVKYTVLSTIRVELEKYSLKGVKISEDVKYTDFVVNHYKTDSESI